ncbi:MAG TPA: hypothetical protein VMW72_19150 [Sedimentisphaerales bacterium]|nr:hypothetical protein [Sedimentisphaerales bacterium]
MSKITAYDGLAPAASLLPAPVGLAGTGAKQHDGGAFHMDTYASACWKGSSTNRHIEVMRDKGNG